MGKFLHDLLLTSILCYILDDCGVADLTKSADTCSTCTHTVSKILHPSTEYATFSQ